MVMVQLVFRPQPFLAPQCGSPVGGAQVGGAAFLGSRAE
jgi:hypothetical protein